MGTTSGSTNPIGARLHTITSALDNNIPGPSYCYSAVLFTIDQSASKASLFNAFSNAERLTVN